MIPNTLNTAGTNITNSNRITKNLIKATYYPLLYPYDYPKIMAWGYILWTI